MILDLRFIESWDLLFSSLCVTILNLIKAASLTNGTSSLTRTPCIYTMLVPAWSCSNVPRKVDSFSLSFEMPQIPSLDSNGTNAHKARYNTAYRASSKLSILFINKVPSHRIGDRVHRCVVKNICLHVLLRPFPQTKILFRRFIVIFTISLSSMRRPTHLNGFRARNCDCEAWRTMRTYDQTCQSFRTSIVFVVNLEN